MCSSKTYNLASLGFFATFGLVMVVLAISFDDIGKHELSYLNQISFDWNKQPFVSIQATKATTCPLGTEEVIYKPWYGTKLYCVCNHVAYKRHYEGACNRDRNSEDAASCMEFPALSPVMQA